VTPEAILGFAARLSASSCVLLIQDTTDFAHHPSTTHLDNLVQSFVQYHQAAVVSAGDGFTPQRLLFTAAGLLFDLVVLPAVSLGAWLGRWALPHLPQRFFDVVVLGLSAVTTFTLIFG
jgi:hypothetical protein